jgi:hypothetical protein
MPSDLFNDGIDQFHTFGISVAVNSTKYLFLSGYRSPSTKVHSNATDIITVAYQHLSSYDHIILGADFNAHHRFWFSYKTDVAGKHLYNIINTSPFYILNNEHPTLSNRKSIIDLSIATHHTVKYIKNWRIIDDVAIRNISDHNLILFNVMKDRPVDNNPFVTWNVGPGANWELYAEQLQLRTEEWHFTVDVSADALAFQELIYQSAVHSVGTKTKYRFRKPWWNHNLQQLKGKVKRLLRRRKKAKSDATLRQKYYHLRRRLTTKLHRRRSTWRVAYNNLLANNSLSSKEFWRAIKSTQQYSIQRVADFVFPDRTITDLPEKLNILCDTFLTPPQPTHLYHRHHQHYQQIEQRYEQILREERTTTGLRASDSTDFLNRPFSIAELDHIISQLQTDKASGPDNIHVAFVKHLSPDARAILLQLYK